MYISYNSNNNIFSHNFCKYSQLKYFLDKNCDSEIICISDKPVSEYFNKSLDLEYITTLFREYDLWLAFQSLGKM